jgi:long-chain fatty acid transport protein
MVGAAAVVIVIGAPVPELFALGFRNPDQGAAATAQGNAFVAQADDATAVYYNPAGLTQIKGTEIDSGGDLSFPDDKLKGGGSGAKMNTMSLIPHLYATTDFGMTNSPWRFAIGVNVPFGSESEYSQSGPFSNLVTKASMQVFNIQPTVAYKFNEHLSLGAGLNVYDAYTALNSHALTEDGHFHFDGGGVAVGGTAGLMWKITPQHTVGVVYRSPFTVNFKGPAQLNVPSYSIKESSGGQASMRFPQTIAAGYAFRPVPKLKLEADVEWTDWQPLHQLTLHAPNSPLVNGKVIPFNWMDSFLYEFGAQYDVNQHWKVRGGYIYSTDTVPNSSFSPSVPDSTRHVFSVGVGYATTRFTIDAVYQYTIAEDRTVNNGSAADGTWQISNNSVMVTTGLKF